MISGQWEISFRAVKDNDSLPNYRPLVRWHMAPPHWQSLAKPISILIGWRCPFLLFFPNTTLLSGCINWLFSFYYNKHHPTCWLVPFPHPLVLSQFRQINIFIYVHLIHRPFCCFSFTLFSPQIKTRRGTAKFNSGVTSTVCPRHK